MEIEIRENGTEIMNNSLKDVGGIRDALNDVIELVFKSALDGRKAEVIIVDILYEGETDEQND